jgi:beta-mannosidase
MELMAAEARQIIPGRRNHPSLAIWCGGNELQSGSGRPLDDDYPLLAALRDIVQELDPDRQWLPTSPSGPVFANSLDNISRDPLRLHDVHGPWEHQGLNRHQTLYNQGASLLHSEFGVEGITNLKALNKVISKEKQWPVSLENPVWEHLGAWWVKEPLWREVFGELAGVEATVRAIQFLQADGLRYAVEADRRRQYHNSGSLPWQFNEPYPMAACTSAVDYFAEPKPAYFAVARAYAPLLVSAQFPKQAWEGEAVFESEVWVSSSLHQEFREVVLEVRITGASGRCYDIRRKTVALQPNSSAPLTTVSWPLSEMEDEIFFLDLGLIRPGGAQFAENRYVFTRTGTLAALLSVPETTLDVGAEIQEDRWMIAVRNLGKHAALFVWLEDGREPETGGPAGDTVYFDCNHFCLFPNERRTVAADWAGVPTNQRRITVGGWNTNICRVQG